MSSTLQTTVATSTAEAEAMSLFAASQDVEFLQGLANEIEITSEKPTKIQVANQACIALTKNTVKSQKVKHCAIKLSFIREKVEMRSLDVEFCSTSEMIADLLTKPLEKLRLKCSAKDSPENITCNRAPKWGSFKIHKGNSMFRS